MTTPEFSDSVTRATPHAAVRDLFDAAFPEGAEWPPFAATVKAPGSIEIELLDAAPPIMRALALGAFACALGDEDGPEMIPGGRYTCGEFAGTFFLIRANITADEQAELEAFARSLGDAIGE